MFNINFYFITSPINIQGSNLIEICVIKAAAFKNTNGIQVTLAIICSLYCFVNTYADTTKKHKDVPRVDINVNGRLPIQWINIRQSILPDNCAIPRINVDV